MPSGRLLVRVGHLEQGRLLERRRSDLQADGQAPGGEPAVHADGRRAGEVERDRAQGAPGAAGVLQGDTPRGRFHVPAPAFLHGLRGHAHRRTHDHVHLPESIVEGFADEPAHPLGGHVAVGGDGQRAHLPVQQLRTVIPRTGAQEGLGRGQVLHPGDAGLHRGDVLHVGDRQFSHGHAQGLQQPHGLRHRLLDLVHRKGVEVAADGPDPQARHPLAHAGAEVRRRGVAAQGVLGVETGDGLEHQGAVAHRPGEDAEVVGGVTAGAGHPAGAAHPAVGGLESHHTAQGRGVAHGAGVVGADGPQRKAGRHRRRGAAAGAARHAVPVPRVARGAVVGVDGGAPRGPFVQVGLAQDHRPCLPEPCHYSGVLVRDPIGQHLRARGGAHPRGGQVVLDGDRNAVQQAAAAPRGQLGFGPGRVRQRPLPGHGDVRVEIRVQAVDSLQVRTGQLHRREIAGLDPARRLGDGQVLEVHHR